MQSAPSLRSARGSCASRASQVASPHHRPRHAVVRRAAIEEEEALTTTSSSPSPSAPNPEALAAERRRGIKTVLAELKGLDMPPAQVLVYAQNAVRLPKRPPRDAVGVDVARAAAALAELMAADGGEATTTTAAASNDPAALSALNHLLTDLWRWKRRGGGARWDEDDQATSPAAVALLELQDVALGGGESGGGKAGGGEGEQASSSSSPASFFDAPGANLTEREKQELAGMMRGAAMAGVQNAFWGSLVLSGLVLLALNFARGG